MISWLIYPILEALVQGLSFKFWPKLFKRSFRPDYHTLRIIRGLVYFAWVIYLQSIISLPLEGWPPVVFVLLTAIFATTSFWNLFDLLLNLFRGKDWDYSGTESGILDDLDDKSQKRYITYKLIALILSITSLILFWHVF